MSGETIYLDYKRATLHKKGALLEVRTKEGTLAEIRPAFVERLILKGSLSLTPAAMELLLDEGVHTVFLSHRGRYKAHIAADAGRHIQLRMAQYKHTACTDRSLLTAKQIARGKIKNQRRLLHAHHKNHANEALGLAIQALDRSVRDIDMASTLDTVRGLEGAAAARYFGVFGILLRNEDFTFSTRTRRPPLDPVNALLSLAYTLLSNAIQAAVHCVGLDPFLASLHSIEDRRPSLVCDLVEEFRDRLADNWIITSINRGQIRLDDFQEPDSTGRVSLTRTGFRKVASLFEEELERRQLYPPTQTSTRNRDIILEQVRSYARHVRDEEIYIPIGSYED